MFASRKALLLNMSLSCFTLWLCHSIIIRCPLSGMLVVRQLCVVCLRYYVHLHRRTLYQSLEKGASRQGHISFSSTLHSMQILPLFFCQRQHRRECDASTTLLVIDLYQSVHQQRRAAPLVLVWPSSVHSLPSSPAAAAMEPDTVVGMPWYCLAVGCA